MCEFTKIRFKNIARIIWYGCINLQVWMPSLLRGARLFWILALKLFVLLLETDEIEEICTIRLSNIFIADPWLESTRFEDTTN